MLIFGGRRKTPLVLILPRSIRLLTNSMRHTHFIYTGITKSAVIEVLSYKIFLSADLLFTLSDLLARIAPLMEQLPSSSAIHWFTGFREWDMRFESRYGVISNYSVNSDDGRYSSAMCRGVEISLRGDDTSADAEDSICYETKFSRLSHPERPE
jgi:hypothetical protein